MSERSPLFRGIDLSRWNRVKDWEKVKKSVDFIMLRIGGNEGIKQPNPYKDMVFDDYYNACKKHKIPVGCYYMLPRHPDAAREAGHLISLLQGKQFEYPIALDVELQLQEDREENTKQIKDMCEILENLGYYVIIYSNPNFFNNFLGDLSAYDKWVAAWSSTESRDWRGGMWQYTNQLKVDGIDSPVDGDYAFYDYELLMFDNNLNGFKNDYRDQYTCTLTTCMNYEQCAKRKGKKTC